MGAEAADTEKGRERRPTSIDIARAAGVSQATVSRALADGGKVSAETRARVRHVAEELGYSPNAVARGLVTSRSGVVGVVVADIRNPFYPQMLEPVGTRLTSLGRHMLLQNAASTSEEDAAALLLQQRVDGIIFTTAFTDSEVVRKLAERRFPIVLSNRIADIDSDTVEGDNSRGTREAIDHLLALGHRRIATIAGDPRASTTQQRSAAYRDHLAEVGIAYRPDYLVTTDFSYAEAYEAALELLALAEPPTAVFCQNDLTAFACINAARSQGASVPGDLSVVGFDDVQESSWEVFNLTTVRQPSVEMAVRAVDLLAERIDDPTLPARHVVFESPLVVRGTTAAPWNP